MGDGLDLQDVEELLRLVSHARSVEIVDDVLRGSRPSTRSVNLLQLELKLYRLKREVS